VPGGSGKALSLRLRDDRAVVGLGDDVAAERSTAPMLDEDATLLTGGFREVLRQGRRLYNHVRRTIELDNDI
jgi:hypothetical protein